MPWWEPDNAQETVEFSGDMYAAPGESTEFIVDNYRRACAHADQTIAELDLDDIGTVPHDGEKITLRQALVHVIHETSRHAGHADIVRELIDGSIGGERETPGSTIWPMKPGGRSTSHALKHQRLPLSRLRTNVHRNTYRAARKGRR